MYVLCLRRSEECVRFPRTGVTIVRSCVGTGNSGSLEEQEHFTAEPSL